MTIKEALAVLDYGLNMKKKFLGRCEKFGIAVEGDEIADDDVKKILEQKEEYIKLDAFLKERGCGFNAYELSLFARILTRRLPESFLRSYDTMFSMESNAYFIKTDAAKEVISIWRECENEGFEKVLKSLQKKSIPTETKKQEKESSSVSQKPESDYVELREVMRMVGCEAVNAKSLEDYRVFLQRRNWFGAEVKYEAWTNYQVLVKRKDAGFLAEKSKKFFAEYGLTSEEKAAKVLEDNKHALPETTALLKGWLYMRHITPSTVDMMKVVLASGKELKNMTAGDVNDLVELMAPAMFSEFKDFLSYAHRKGAASDLEVKRCAQKPQARTGYTKAEVAVFASLVFGNEKLKENTEKALADHFYCETWLYLSFCLVTEWRGVDICEKIKYLELDKNSYNSVDVDLNTLRDDILADRILEKTYRNAAELMLTMTMASMPHPHKTLEKQSPLLHITISESLKPIIGRILLISEFWHFYNGEGFLKKERVAAYSNRIRLNNFFESEDLKSVLGNSNFSIRKMNHYNLTCVEETARRQGYGDKSWLIASYARSHKSSSTINHYIDSRSETVTLTEVLQAVLDRGVYGSLLYTLFETAFGQEFRNLAVADKTALITESSFDAFRAEELFRIFDQSKDATGKMLGGQAEFDSAAEAFEALRSLGRGEGRGKDTGTYCLMKNFGKICPHPEYTSCIAENCEYCNYTKYILTPILEMIRDQRESGKPNADAVVEKILLPRLREIIYRLNVTDDEKRDTVRALKKIKIQVETPEGN